MNKICGYSCEHNKGGVCQITMCDKQIYITTKTDEPLQKQLEKYTKYKIQKDENFELRKIHELQQELQRKDNIINELKQNKRDYERENILEMKLHILDNNWSELKEWLDKRSELTNMGIVLDKMKEIENGE